MEYNGCLIIKAPTEARCWNIY
uniref:Uncharacterized protein n=1 Tax=Salix viminalis TaxID=40686 RepID=A0A6N2LM17_SALVM